MTGRINTKLAWVVVAGVLWAWTGLYLALGAPQRGQPIIGLGLKPGEEGVVLKGRLAELVEDEQGIHLKLDYRGKAGRTGRVPGGPSRGPGGIEGDAAPQREGAPGGEFKPPEIPKLPPGITVEYLPATDFPRPPRIEVHSGFGPIRRPTGGLLVAARDYIFQVDRAQVRIVTAPPGSPLRRRLERMEEERERHPGIDQRRDRRQDRRERIREKLGPGGDRAGGPRGRPEAPPPGEPPLEDSGPGPTTP